MPTVLIPVILSGGAGSRLWPVSREAFPKPFIRLADGESLIQKTLERAVSIQGVTEILTLTSGEYYFLAQDQYAALGHAEHRFILEPCARNTAPAIAMAAFYAAQAHGLDAQLLVLPADHLIRDLAAFGEAVAVARAAASSGALVTFGIVPTRAETGYGYIECGEAAAGGAWHARRFIEKPSAAVALEFLASGRFLWNSGMFCFQAGAFLQALERCAPELYALAASCWDASARGSGATRLDAGQFARLPDISVDYAVMERHAGVVVVKARFDWSDIGSWTALSELTAADEHGNRIVGEALTFEARDCFIHSDSRLVAALGTRDLVVVDTPDALLIAHRERAQDVKQVYARLKANKHPAHELHRTVQRPWGSYTVLEEAPGHKIKRIVVKPGAALSLQLHRHRNEHWVVLAGTATVTNGERRYSVCRNEAVYIPAGNKHRLENCTGEDLVISEVQTGDYLGEDDIVRFEDVYGRS
jgi:mannose-1-phosphate guanylyltransferase/mannose-6-phosphate isomerase